jgi:hypothetical protein
MIQGQKEMDEIEEFLRPQVVVSHGECLLREQRLVKALRCALQQRDKQYDWFEEPEAKKKKTLANREVLLFLRGTIQ